MIEAMSSGLACIVSDVGSISSYIKHEENGLLIKPNCPDEFASSMSPYAFILMLLFWTLEPSPRLVKPLSPPRV